MPEPPPQNPLDAARRHRADRLRALSEVQDAQRRAVPNSTTQRANAGVMAALRTWTDDLVAKANALLAIGSSPAVVAEEIGKTVKAVRRAIERRLIGATMAQRKCLKCTKPYAPRWAQNWLCEACGKTGGLSDAGAVASVSKFVRGLD